MKTSVKSNYRTATPKNTTSIRSVQSGHNDVLSPLLLLLHAHYTRQYALGHIVSLSCISRIASNVVTFRNIPLARHKVGLYIVERLNADNIYITSASTNRLTVFHPRWFTCINFLRMHTHIVRHWLTFYAYRDVIYIAANYMHIIIPSARALLGLCIQSL